MAIDVATDLSRAAARLCGWRRPAARWLVHDTGR